MKRIIIAATIVGGLALISSLHAEGISRRLIKHPELTVWVSSQTGSHIGSGYASTYLTNIRPRTIANEDSQVRDAIKSLDDLGMLSVRGFGLLPAAVAWKTQQPMRTIILQQAETGLSYGELLMVNCLASKSNQSFDQVIALRAKSHTWGEVAQQLGLHSDCIVASAKSTAERIRAVDYRSRHRQQHDQTSVTSVNPHTQFAHHH
jgi:hypothetical protein